MRSSVLFLLALVAPKESSSDQQMLTEHDNYNLKDDCSQEITFPNFIAAAKCGYSFPALEEVIISHRMNKWDKVTTVTQIISLPWAYKIPFESFHCHSKAILDKHDELMQAIIQYHHCMLHGPRGAK